MMKFVLIMMLLSNGTNGGNFIHSVEFNTETECVTAGEEFKAKAVQYTQFGYKLPSYLCAEKTPAL